MASLPLPSVPPIYTEQAFTPSVIIVAIVGAIAAVVITAVWNALQKKPRPKTSTERPTRSRNVFTRSEAVEILLAYIPERKIRTAMSYVIAPRRPVPDRGFPVHLFRPVSCTGHPYGEIAVYDDGLVLTYVDDVDEWVQVSHDRQLPSDAN